MRDSRIFAIELRHVSAAIQLHGPIKFQFSKMAATVGCAWMCLAPMGAAADSTKDVEYLRKISAITESVVDLTSELAPALDPDFVSWRRSITKSNAAIVVRLIQEGRIKGVPAEIGVLVCTGLNEEDFATVMVPLLKESTEPDVLLQIVSPAQPYGPGLCNTGRKGKTQKALEAIAKHSRASSSLKAAIEDVLTGAAAKDYSEFRKEPEAFGYGTEIVAKLAISPR